MSRLRTTQATPATASIRDHLRAEKSANGGDKEFTLRQIKYFVAASEAGQISDAGARLGVSQSAVTEAVRALESVTCVKLIKRHSRGISLTQEGFQFLNHARKILAAVGDAYLTISNANPRFSGRLRLGVTVTVAGYFLASPLTRFRRTFPNVDVELVELNRPDVERGLANKSLDMGLLLLAHFQDSERLETMTLMSSRRRLWLPPNHGLMEKPKIKLSDIAGEPYLLLTTDENVRTTEHYWKKHRLKPNIVFRTASIEAIRSLVANGFGVTVLSDMVYRPWSLEGERIMARPVADSVPGLDVGLAWRKGAALPEAARLFRDFVLEGSTITYGQFSMTPNFLRDAESSAGPRVRAP